MIPEYKALPLKDDGAPILFCLEDCRIVSFERDGDSVIVEEVCDGYFRRRMSKEQLSRLIAELQALHDQL